MGFINQKAVNFDGSNNHLIVDAHSSIDDIFNSGATISAWLELTDVSSARRFLDKSEWYIYFQQESGGFCKILFFQEFSSTDGIWVSDRDVPVGSRFHIRIQYRNSGVGFNPRVYIDDVEITLTESSTPVGTRVDDSGSDLYIGINNNGVGQPFYGTMDELSIWSSNTVDRLYNGGRPTDLLTHDNVASLQLWLRMGDGDTYPTIQDYSTNSNDATMTSMSSADIVSTSLGPTIKTDWQFLIDWNNDNDYNDAYEDITGDVMQASWRIGFNEPYQHVAGEPRGQFILRNDDKKYSPENSSSPLYGNLLPFRRCKIQNIEDGTVVMYQGYIKSINPATGLYGDLTCLIEVGGIKSFLEEQEFYSPFYEDVTTDEVLSDVLSETSMPATFGQYLFINRTGQNLIDTHYIAEDGNFIDAETGATTFPYVGDTWEEGVTAIQAINSLVQSDRGWFFEARSGSATYWNRHHILINDTVQGTVDNTWADLEYRYSQEDIKNIIRVSNYPREISDSSDIVLWSLPEIKRVQVGESVTFRARYAEQDSEAKIAARNVTIPNEEDGSFVITPATGQYRITAEENNARSMQIIVENVGDVKFDITVMQVKGQTITTYNKEEYEVLDTTSVALYGRHVMKLDHNLLDNDAFARAIGDYELVRRKDPRGVVRSLTLNQRSETTRELAIQRTVGDWVRVIDDQSDHDANYVVMGESHRWRSGDVHTVEWVLEPTDGLDYIIIDKSGKNEIDSGRYIAA